MDMMLEGLTPAGGNGEVLLLDRGGVRVNWFTWVYELRVVGGLERF